MFMSLEKGGMDIIGEAIKKTGTFKSKLMNTLA
jgi:DNA polymerase-3 subunit delta'